MEKVIALSAAEDKNVIIPNLCQVALGETINGLCSSHHLLSEKGRGGERIRKKLGGEKEKNG